MSFRCCCCQYLTFQYIYLQLFVLAYQYIYIYLLLFVYIYYTDSLSICVVEPSSQVFCWRIGYDVTFLKQGSMANGSWNAALRQMDRILAKLVWSASILQLPFYVQGQFYRPTFTIQLLQRARVMKHLKRAATDFGGASVFPSFQLGLLPSSIGGYGIHELQLHWRNCQELGCGMASSLIWRFCLVLSWWKDLGKGTLMERYRNNVVNSLKDPTSGCFKTTDQPPLFSNQNSVISVAFGCKSFWDIPAIDSPVLIFLGTGWMSLPCVSVGCCDLVNDVGFSFSLFRSRMRWVYCPVPYARRIPKVF